MSKNIKHTPLVVMDHDINFTGNLRCLAEPLKKKTKLKLGGHSCLLIPGGLNTGACIHLIISNCSFREQKSSCFTRQCCNTTSLTPKQIKQCGVLFTWQLMNIFSVSNCEADGAKAVC